MHNKIRALMDLVTEINHVIESLENATTDEELETAMDDLETQSGVIQAIIDEHRGLDALVIGKGSE